MSENAKVAWISSMIVGACICGAFAMPHLKLLLGVQQ